MNSNLIRYFCFLVLMVFFAPQGTSLEGGLYFPGDAEVASLASSRCPVGFAFALWPTDESWRQDDREVVCFE